VELLSREFADSQIILSTHEDTFAKYIGYKYKKYGLDHRAISLKENWANKQNTYCSYTP
jgi:exonuclease SbcC